MIQTFESFPNQIVNKSLLHPIIAYFLFTLKDKLSGNDKETLVTYDELSSQIQIE
jgi:hypothetical protein